MTPVAEAIEQRALTTAEQAKLIVVRSLAERGMAAELGCGIAALEKEVTDFFKPMKDAAYKTHREICAKENQVILPLTEAKRYLSTQIGTYDQEQERIRREEEARLQREAELQAAAVARALAEEQAIQDAIQLEAEGDSKGAAAVLNNPQPVPVYVPPVILQKQQIKTPGVSSTNRWEFRITNEALIPREYLMVDQVKIGQVVRALKDKCSIPGVQVVPTGGARFKA